MMSAFKDGSVMIHNFDDAHKLMNIDQSNIRDKYDIFYSRQDLFFIDYKFVLLFIQESCPSLFENDHTEIVYLENMVDAAEFIYRGDIISAQIRMDQWWSLPQIITSWVL